MLTASIASIAVLTLTSCSGPGRAGASSHPAPVLASRVAMILRTMHCGRRLPPSNGRYLAAPTPGIRPGPPVALICEYEYRNGNLNAFDLTRRTMLTGRAADGLVAVLDSARSVQPDQSSCGGGPSERGSAVVIKLGYPGGRRTSATVDVQTCEGSISALETAGNFFQLPWPVIDALLYRVADSSGNRGPRVPDLTGLSLAAAAAAARARGLVLSLSGVVVDQRAPLGSVVYQAVPAGTRSRLRNGPSVRVIVAVRSAPACAARQLRLTYRYSGASRGTEWGAVAISDTGAAPCRLPATAQITGLGQAGQPVAGPFAAAARNLRAPAEDATTAPLILGPLLTPIPDGLVAPYGFPPPLSGLVGAITMETGYPKPSAGSDGTPCPGRLGIPVAWRVVIGSLSFTVPNVDPGGRNPLVPSGAFAICGHEGLNPVLTYYGLLTY